MSEVYILRLQGATWVEIAETLGYKSPTKLRLAILKGLK